MSNQAQQERYEQLIMKKCGMENLPQINLPEGYTLRTYRPGDEKKWEEVTDKAFGGVHRFLDSMKDAVTRFPDGIFFICHGEKIVATTAALVTERDGRKMGYVHMVAADPEHNGRKLGYNVVLAVLHKIAAYGLDCAILTTDDHRLPAIKVYLQLGFKPVIPNDGHKSRWKVILEKLGENQLLQTI